MEPVKSNTHTSSGCSPVASNCVIWSGPDIPCINLCKGDTITKAIENLANILCQSTQGVIDISSLDFKCLVEENQNDPQSLIELLQKIIDKTCQQINQDPDENTSSEIDLPACLYFTQSGTIITKLPAEEYSILLANRICQILTSIQSHQSQLNSLNTRVTILENKPDPSVEAINVSSQCMSSGVPGQSIVITEAFFNLENFLCQLSGTLGTSNQLSGSISRQCSGLSSKPSLANPGVTMGSLSGWKTSPSTVADTLNNMWITLCDIRTKLENC
jgi:hypothetical protein